MGTVIVLKIIGYAILCSIGFLYGFVMELYRNGLLDEKLKDWLRRF